MAYLHILIDLSTMRLSRGNAHELKREILDILSSSNLDHRSGRESELYFVLLEVIIRDVNGAAVVVGECLAISAVAGECGAS